jgi:hypothetical protein
VENEKNNKYIDEEIKSPLRMLLLGGILNEEGLYNEFSKRDVSLYSIKKDLSLIIYVKYLMMDIDILGVHLA